MAQSTTGQMSLNRLGGLTDMGFAAGIVLILAVLFLPLPPLLIDAGLAGMTFGTGAGGQTNLGTDGGQFKAAAMAYKAAPVAL